MMRALIAREAQWIAGSGGFWAAVWTHAAWLAAFLILWGGGVGTPFIMGRTIYEQLVIVQYALMLWLLPWAAARALAPERGDAAVQAAACLGVRPSQLLAARCVALSAALALLVAAGLPMVVVAQRMADAAFWRALLDQAAVAGFGTAVAVAVVVLQQVMASRVAVWLLTTASAFAMATAIRELDLGAPAIVGVALGGSAAAAGLLAARADSTLRYLSERTA